MTSPNPALPKARREVVRELLGLLLVIAGALGAVVAAYQIRPALAALLLSLAVVVCGFRFGLTSTSEE